MEAQPPGDCTAYQQIPCISEPISPEEFERQYLAKGLPVVMRGACNDWPARSWTLEGLAQKCPDSEVIVRKRTSKVDYRLGKKIPIQKMAFPEYIDGLLRKTKASSDCYLAANNIRRVLPELESDFHVPDFVGKLHSGPFLWVAAAGHYEFMHFDPDDGLLMLLHGRKRCRLFPPSQLPNLYPNQLGSYGRTIQSTADLDAPDAARQPLFRAALEHACETTLEAGDMLYIPALWFHQILSPEQCISINIFWGDKGESAFVSKCLRNCREALMHWLVNVVEQNR